ncbi:MAG: hypothetical protein F2667_10055 [Actinobacteria bacterium]|nr:hypothetical protein [Actinomycetota bacterium]
MLDVTASIVEYLAGQTARRCGPCFNGLPALADAVRGLVDARPGSRERAVALVGLVEGRGACAHPDGTVRMVRSLMSTFDHEVEAHARGGCSSSGHLLQARR